MSKVKIGVFDSGVGGLSVANAIQRQLPKLQLIYKDDKEHVPYGRRKIKEIHGFIRPIFQSFLDEDCQAIVVACNTVTTNLIAELRKEFPVPLVGMEPMVKPAAEQTKSGVIAVCATPTTLASQRYRWLKDTYAKEVKVVEPDCSDWSYMIENNQVEHDKIQQRIDGAIAEGADIIVLGCTHYHWIEELINQIANGRASVLQPEQPVISQLKKVLSRPA